MKEFFVAPWQSGPDAAAFGGIAPIARGGDSAGISAETNSENPFAEAFAGELANIAFAARVHFGGARIAQMRIVAQTITLLRPPSK